jgi:hypothetical protein
MKPDCRNDCVDPIEFPKVIHNRPGLPHIDYRIGTYSDFLEAILRNLNKNGVLRSWSHREADDPGIALLEGASILGDILTFYQEQYANEAFLRTAQWRESVADLVKLLGYRMSPGVGGNATFAFEVSGEKTVTVPSGFPVKAQLEGSDQPAVFETISKIEAVPALSSFHLYRPTEHPSIETDANWFAVKTSTLEESGMELKEGDRLMLVASPGSHDTERQIVVIAETRELFDCTEIKIEGGWQGSRIAGADSEIAAFKLGRSFRHFGYNAPPTKTTFSTSGSVTTVQETNVVFYMNLDDNGSDVLAFHLDREVDDLSSGSTILVSLELSTYQRAVKTEYFLVRTINSVRASSDTRGSMTGGTTLVELDLKLSVGNKKCTDIRSVQFHEVLGRKLTFYAAREPEEFDGRSLDYYGDAESYKELDGRKIQMVEENMLEEVTVTIVKEPDADDTSTTLRRLSLDPVLSTFGIDDFPLEDPEVTVYGNLADADQGKTEKEVVLGNGDSRQPFQTFKIPKTPLTYHKDAGETPPEVPELWLYVNDRLWTLVPTLFNCNSDEEVYIVREDADGESWIQCGDGKTGRRFPSGIKNIVAKYRTGTGAKGALAEETTVQAGAKLDKLGKIHMPGSASGGSEAETGDNAREAAPGKVQSLDRLVSISDFECEALGISGVSKVRAVWDDPRGVPSICLTVLLESGSGQDAESIRETMTNYNRCRGPERFPIEVRQGTAQYVYIAASYGFDPTYREENVVKLIKEALGIAGEEDDGVDGSKGLFSLSNRRFGQQEYAKRVVAAIQNVEGVLWAEITAFDSLGHTMEPSDSDLAAMRFLPRMPCGKYSLLSLHSGNLELTSVSSSDTEAC